MKRHSFQHEGLTFSYLDTEGEGQPLIALPALWMEGASFEKLSDALAPGVRVIALDQRGHGHSDHAKSYTRGDYIGDVKALFGHLRLEKAVLLGTSLGGVNAYQFAARHPEQVTALIIESVGAVVEGDLPLVLEWGGVFPSREALAEQIGSRFATYLEPSFRQTSEGWQLAFEPQDMLETEKHLQGDYWDDWLATDCPALVVRGSDDRATTPEEMEELAARRPNAELIVLDSGHIVHEDATDAYASSVKKLLAEI